MPVVHGCGSRSAAAVSRGGPFLQALCRLSISRELFDSGVADIIGQMARKYNRCDGSGDSFRNTRNQPFQKRLKNRE